MTNVSIHHFQPSTKHEQTTSTWETCGIKKNHPSPKKIHCWLDFQIQLPTLPPNQILPHMQMQHQWVSNNQSTYQIASLCGQISTCPYSSFEDDILKCNQNSSNIKKCVVFIWLTGISNICCANITRVGNLFCSLCHQDKAHLLFSTSIGYWRNPTSSLNIRSQ